MAGEYQVSGGNADAAFTLKIHRGEGMALLAMNWRKKEPPPDFVGFAIEYREPGGARYFALKNRLGFLPPSGKPLAAGTSTLLAPIQKFRWVHFPRKAETAGEFTYRVTPLFMNEQGELSQGEAQEASITLMRETYPGLANVTFTRGFVSSQAFVDRYTKAGIKTLLPAKSADGLVFKATHPKAEEALAWMGFEARHAILEVLDQAIADATAQVRVVAYDLSEPDVVGRLEKLGARLKVIIDDSGEHKPKDSGESQAADRLTAAGAEVKRQHMTKLQHNKTIAVLGDTVQAAVCGSTNFTWRGFFVQSNNALVVHGAKAVAPFMKAFDNYWNKQADFGSTASAGWQSLGLPGVKAKIAFSPHTPANRLLDGIGQDIATTQSSLFYSLAFLYQTPGVIKKAIEKAVDADLFVYGISDQKVGLSLQKPDGKVAPVYPVELAANLPEPFKSEPSGKAGNFGNRMHHKFVVIDFDKPSARVYTGSYNFSEPADGQNGENLVLIEDRRIATSYMVEAVRIFDHYHFRVAQLDAEKAQKVLALKRPPRADGEEPWWVEDYREPSKIRDRLLFA